MQNVTVALDGHQSLEVSWQRVPAGYENGIIKGYRIFMQKLNSSIGETVIVNGDRPISTRIGGLEPSTTYTVQVSAMDRRVQVKFNSESINWFPLLMQRH